MTYKLLISAIALVSITAPAVADQRPHTHAGDDRLAHFHYSDSDVYHVDLNQKFITSIKFDKGEQVTSIQIGDSESFQVARLKSGDVVTIKPLIATAQTNMNIITSKGRSYTFFLNATSRMSAKGKNFRLSMRFKPDPIGQRGFASRTSGTRSSGRVVNNDYVVAGNADFIPLQVYDDGVNTWLQYAASSRRPAVFSADAKGRESIINFTNHVNHKVQLHGLSDEWVLRIGDEFVCIRRKGGQTTPLGTISKVGRSAVTQTPVITMVRPAGA